MKVSHAEFVLSATDERAFVRDGRPAIAFVGRSNVGKSSLLNKLLARRGLARTSSTPGRTQSVNYFLVDRRFYFVDLPGYGYARASKADRARWAELIDAYFRGAAGRVLLVQLVDGKVGATPLDAQAATYLRGLGIEPRVVATKIDKVSRALRQKSLQTIRQTLHLPPPRDPLPLSAVTGEGTRELWKDIQDFLERAPPAGNG